MFAKVLDEEALRSISPVALGAYARSLGWTKTQPYGDRADVYQAFNLPEILIPRSAALGDYASVLSRLLAIFSEHLQRDEVSVYRDLIGSERDVIRVRSYGADEDGTVDIDAGVKLVQQSREMLLAAACAARSRQPLFRAGANKEATEYLRRVKLGQTEHGSFVVTLLSPVPPKLQHDLEFVLPDLSEEPVGRLVTRTLATALRSARTATESVNSGEFDAFDDAVDAGVSANLCEAVAVLIDQSGHLDISLTWALTRPIPENNFRVTFKDSDAEILREAARNYRDRVPRPDTSLIATINRLQREYEKTDGAVGLKAVLDDRMQTVKAVLDKANYANAIRAHENHQSVIASGDLERVGARWQMLNAQIRVIEPAGEGEGEGDE